MSKLRPFQFYAEHVFGSKASTIPERLRKDRRERTKWGIRQIVGELVRDHGQCPHVDAKAPPVHVHGYEPERLHELAETLEELTDRYRETYTRRGKTHTRAIKNTTPILLAAVASFPDTEKLERRDYWTNLVVGAAMDRWGKRLASIVGHSDESHYHLHILVHNVGASVKPHHMGHAAAEAEPEKARKGHAYRAGCVKALDWYWEKVGKSMEWIRKSPSPRPRMSRAKAMATRARQLELEADDQAKARREMRKMLDVLEERSAQQLMRHNAMVSKEARLLEQEEELFRAAAMLSEMRTLIKSQELLARRTEQLLGGRSVPEVIKAAFGLR